MQTYSIREICGMFQLPASTIRYYEEAGILTNIERTASGQRIFTDAHIQRLKGICCFKNTGMTIAQLKLFFYYESEGFEHLDEILSLLDSQKESVAKKLTELQADYAHVLRKLRYYGDIKKSLSEGRPLPRWEDYECLQCP